MRFARNPPLKPRAAMLSGTPSHAAKSCPIDPSRAANIAGCQRSPATRLWHSPRMLSNIPPAILDALSLTCATRLISLRRSYTSLHLYGRYCEGILRGSDHIAEPDPAWRSDEPSCPANSNAPFKRLEGYEVLDGTRASCPALREAGGETPPAYSFCVARATQPADAVYETRQRPYKLDQRLVSEVNYATY